MTVAKQSPAQAVIVPTERPDEYRFVFQLSPAKRLLALQRHRRLTKVTTPMLSLKERIDELIAQHGTLRAAARVLETDAGYLSRLRYGEKEEPGDRLLRRMGLRRVTAYERIGTGPVASGAFPSDAPTVNAEGHVSKGSERDGQTTSSPVSSL